MKIYVILLTFLLVGCRIDEKSPRQPIKCRLFSATRKWKTYEQKNKSSTKSSPDYSGNTNTTNKPWGTIEENGIGKFSDFTAKALREIKELGVTYIWYTGVPHHTVIRDYTANGISNDDPDVVKGRAGSPYAVKDYYNVNPDLAKNPANRFERIQDAYRSHPQSRSAICL